MGTSDAWMWSATLRTAHVPTPHPRTAMLGRRPRMSDESEIGAWRRFRDVIHTLLRLWAMYPGSAVGGIPYRRCAMNPIRSFHRTAEAAIGRGTLMRRRYVVVAVILSLAVALGAAPALAVNSGNLPTRTSPLYQWVNGCEEDVIVTGTETVAAEYRMVNDKNERYRYIVTWDATGVGWTTGAEYEVSYSAHGEGIGWPPLAPPTTNVVKYSSTLRLESDLYGKETHRTRSHRVLHYDEKTGVTTPTGDFQRSTDSC